MSATRVVAILLWIAFFAVVALVATGHRVHAEEGVLVTATLYTCAPHPQNPMNPGTPAPGMCQVTRWGGANVHEPGMACPYWWRDRLYEVPGYGVLRCDDTGRYDTWNGLPHIDIRVQEWPAEPWLGEIVIHPATPSPAPLLANWQRPMHREESAW